MGSQFNHNHKPLYTALYKHLFLSLGVAALAPGALAAEAAHQEWSCRADAEGRWVCREITVPGPDFPRPVRREPVREPTEEPRINLARNLDWIEAEQLTEAEKARMRENCCGAYVEPERNYPEADVDPDEASMRVSATTTEARGNIANLDGDVQVSQGYRQVRSNHATVNQETRMVDLDGNVQFREPGLLLIGEHARVNIDTGEVEVDNARFVMHESGVRGTAEHLERSDSNIIYVDNATYTTCEPRNNAWRLAATDVKIDSPRGVATARNVRLQVKDVPVLYLPWIRYPISDNRATGLLFPYFSTGNENGIDYSQPIYLNLAPNYDATVTPRYVQERGAMVELETRHLSRWGRTAVSGGYLWDDDGGDLSEDEKNADGTLPYEGESRWLVNVDHRGGLGYRWRTRIDYTDVSDDDYFRDLDNTTLQVNSQSHLNQEIHTGYVTDHWVFGVTGQQFETIIQDGRKQYKQLPRVDADGHYRFDALDLVLDVDQHYVVFDHTDDQDLNTGGLFTRDTENTTVTGSRLRADYALTWDKEWLWGFFKPAAKAKYISYDLDNPLIGRDDDSPDVFVPVGSLDTGLYFERNTTWIGNFIQTLEPRVYYLYSEYEDQSAIPDFDTSELTFSYQQLFRDDRFSGGDRIGDSEQVTFGLTTRLLDPDSGSERFRASIGQIYYLDERRVSLRSNQAAELGRDESAIAAELGARFWNNWRLQSDLLYDEKDGLVDKGSIALRYRDNQEAIFNLAYRYTRQGVIFRDVDGDGFPDENNTDIDQVDLSFVLPVADNWKLLGRWNHDLNGSQELEVFAGLEYSSCCWRASVIARRWIERDDNLILQQLEELDHNSGIFFQIQFKGLGGTGSRVDNILSDGIYGYEIPEY
jgi:LPS-assembly protein